MLNFIWSAMILLSVLCSFLLGNADALSSAVMDSAADAISLIITLAGIMCLWSGLMKIAQASGITLMISKVLSPVLGLLFPGVPKSDEAFEYISVNITANLLGMGNTATPFGIKAMERMDKLNSCSRTASDGMIVFVVMNTASLQLLPTTLAGLRASAGSRAPFEILTAVWLSSAASLCVGLTIACGLNRLQRRRRL